MTIINKTRQNLYSELSHNTIGPHQKSYDGDMGDFCKTLRNLIRLCGNACCVRLNSEERTLLLRLESLAAEGDSFHCESPKMAATPVVTTEYARGQKAKMASIEAEMAREKAIMDETTYAGREDMREAHARAAGLQGDVEAKKLDKDVTGTVSIKDLMGDNKFIESSMKHTNIPTAMAAEEGWDMEKVNAPKASEEENRKQEVKDVEEVFGLKSDAGETPATTAAAEAPVAEADPVVGVENKPSTSNRRRGRK